MKHTRSLSISKSTFLMGLRCQKLLWFRYNAKQKIPDPDEQTQSLFEQGHSVGAFAKELFPDAVEVGAGIVHPETVIELTKQAIKLRKTLFEAAFIWNGAYARCDILQPVDGDSFNLFEVKSSTEVKECHLWDVSFQSYVCRGSGLKIRSCFILHINKEFVRNGKIDCSQFFQKVDVTEQTSELSGEVRKMLKDMRAVIRFYDCPDVPIGPACHNPSPCPLCSLCWECLPDHNVASLYYGGKKGFDLMAQGIKRIQDIPENFNLTSRQAIQRQAVISAKPFIDRRAIAHFLEQLRFPISFLDFETLSTAIPLFDKTRPFGQVPFQFSLEILNSENGALDRVMFLAEGPNDPRRDFMVQLRECLPRDGAIVVYNAAFEKRILLECARILPEFSPWVKEALNRFVDLLALFKSFAYYHPEQRGSASIKDVLPAITGRSYNDLSVRSGDAASREYLRVTFQPVRADERAKIYDQLRHYCCRDTTGMIDLIEALKQILEKPSILI